MAESVSGMSFGLAKSLLDIDRRVNQPAASQEEVSLFDFNKDGELDVAEKAAFDTYYDNQDKIKFDFNKDGKLDKAEQSAYEAYTIQRGTEKHEELINDVAKVVAKNKDGSLDTDAVRSFSNERLDEIEDEAFYNEEFKASTAASILAEYNRTNNMNTNEKKAEGIPTPDEIYINAPGNFKLPEPTPKTQESKKILQNLKLEG